MTAEEKKRYVVLEGWSEIGRFENCSDALFFQDFMEHMNPRRKFDLWRQEEGFMRLREGQRFVDEQKENRRGAWLKFISLKGGGNEHGRRKEDLSSYQS